jgi:hypothetical protein
MYQNTLKSFWWVKEPEGAGGPEKVRTDRQDYQYDMI